MAKVKYDPEGHYRAGKEVYASGKDREREESERGPAGLMLGRPCQSWADSKVKGVMGGSWRLVRQEA